jgi:hypothetical protein
LIAAKKTGRKALLIEIDPRYVDVAITRWQNLTGRTAVHADSATPCPSHAPRDARGAPFTSADGEQIDDGAAS